MRLAVATRCLEQPLKSALTLASRMGAAGVQLDGRSEVTPAELSATGVRQLRHLLTELGLQVASLDFPIRRRLWDADQLDARIDALKRAMEFAYRLETRIVTIRLGGLPEESDASGRALLAAALEDLARQSNQVGVTVAVGPGRDSASDLIGVLKQVREGPIGVNFDPATCVAAGDFPSETLRTYGELVLHVIARDATRDSDGTGSEVPLGRGDVPWDETLAILSDMDYRGWLTVERTQGKTPADDAARAVKYLQSIYRG
jgi:sugar phosphate isomerase/epimerase